MSASKSQHIKLTYKRLYEKRYRALRNFKLSEGWASKNVTHEVLEEHRIAFEEADKDYNDYRDDNAEYFV